MHWTVNGADSIIALRCAEVSSQWKPSATTVTTRLGQLTCPHPKMILVTCKFGVHPSVHQHGT